MVSSIPSHQTVCACACMYVQKINDVCIYVCMYVQIVYACACVCMCTYVQKIIVVCIYACMYDIVQITFACACVKAVATGTVGPVSTGPLSCRG